MPAAKLQPNHNTTGVYNIIIIRQNTKYYQYQVNAKHYKLLVNTENALGVPGT